MPVLLYCLVLLCCAAVCTYAVSSRLMRTNEQALCDHAAAPSHPSHHATAQYSTLQYNSPQYSTMQYRAVGAVDKWRYPRRAIKSKPRKHASQTRRRMPHTGNVKGIPLPSSRVALLVLHHTSFTERHWWRSMDIAYSTVAEYSAMLHITMVLQY